MNALIIIGNDIHTRRLITGLEACNIKTFTHSYGVPFQNEKYDLIFLDPSFSGLLPSNLNTEYLFFFDSEDATNHFDKGPAYDQFKDKVKAYVKYNYEIDDRKDQIKNIGMPLINYISLSQIANMQTTFNEQNIKPYLLASPTFIGNYKINPTGFYNIEEDLTCIGEYEKNNLLYNQRIDWLISLRKNNINYEGGLVFTPNCNLSLDWQTKYFGNISKLKTFPQQRNGFIHKLFTNQIGLNPTGHERISWRTFDIMATGAILINTDTKNKLTLINPKEYITIYDGQDLGTELIKLQPHYKEIWQQHQANREIFKTLTPEKLLTLFLNQME